MTPPRVSNWTLWGAPGSMMEQIRHVTELVQMRSSGEIRQERCDETSVSDRNLARPCLPARVLLLICSSELCTCPTTHNPPLHFFFQIRVLGLMWPQPGALGSVVDYRVSYGTDDWFRVDLRCSGKSMKSQLCSADKSELIETSHSTRSASTSATNREATARLCARRSQQPRLRGSRS